MEHIIETRQAYDLATIRDQVLQIFLTTPDEDVYATVLNLLLDITASEYGVFAYIDEEGAAVAPTLTGDVWNVCEIPDKTFRFPRETWGDNLWARALREKRTLIQNTPGKVPPGHVPIHCALVAPILYQDEVLGHFEVANRFGGYGYAEQQLIDKICSFVAPVLHARLLRDRRDAARRQAEASLRESQARYRRLAESTEAVLWEFDLQENRWVYLAPQVAKLTGWPPDVWTDLRFWVERLHPEGRDWAAQFRAECTRRVQDHVSEYRFQKPDGTYVWIRDSVTVTVEDNRPVRLHGFMTNVTERKLADEALKRNEARLRSLVDIMQRPAETIQDLLDHALGQAVQLTNSKTGYLTYYDSDRQQVVLTTSSDAAVRVWDGANPHAADLLEPTAIWTEAIRHRQPIILNDFQAESPLSLAKCHAHLDIERLLIVPVIDGDMVVAVFGVANKEADYTESSALQLTLLMDAVWKMVERRLAQEALAHERRLLRTVIDNLPDAIYAKDSQARKMLANHVDWVNIGAASEADVLGKTDHELFPPEVAERLMADDLYVLETGEPLRNHEEFLVDVHGNARWLLTSKFPIRDATGRVTGLVGTGRDITALRQVEVERQRLLQQVEAQVHRVQQIVDTIPQGLLLLDAEGHILLANPLAQQHLHAFGYNSSDRVARLGDHDLRELLTSPPFGQWHKIRHEARDFEIVAKPVIESETSEHWVLLVNDVTQQRELDDQLHRQERLAAVGQLAAGIAHDFNNIMAVIALHAQMVRQNPDLPADDRAQLHVIDAQSKHAARLIRQILDFSRQSVPDRHPLDLLPLLKEQVKLLERTLPEAVKIRLSHQPGHMLTNADPTQVQQLLMNLAINARDAMPQGGELSIRLECVTFTSRTPVPVVGMGPGAWIRLAVTDTGTGIPADDLPHLFEPFFTTKPYGQGTGLGLPQVYGIVGQHEGYVDVASQVGVGTTFTIYLPALSQPVEAPPDIQTPDIPKGHGEVILVVEDNTALREALRRMIRMWDYTVHEAADGVAALAVLETMCDEVDLVLSDVVMPEMGGVALARALRGKDWLYPIVLMSGHPLTMSPDELRALGVSGWLAKPPTPEQLAKVLAKAISESRS